MNSSAAQRRKGRCKSINISLVLACPYSHVCLRKSTACLYLRVLLRANTVAFDYEIFLVCAIMRCTPGMLASALRCCSRTICAVNFRYSREKRRDHRGNLLAQFISRYITSNDSILRERRRTADEDTFEERFGGSNKNVNLNRYRIERRSVG